MNSGLDFSTPGERNEDELLLVWSFFYHHVICHSRYWRALARHKISQTLYVTRRRVCQQLIEKWTDYPSESPYQRPERRSGSQWADLCGGRLFLPPETSSMLSLITAFRTSSSPDLKNDKKQRRAGQQPMIRLTINPLGHSAAQPETKGALWRHAFCLLFR